MALEVPTCHLPHISPGPHVGAAVVAMVCLMAGASAGVWGRCMALLLLAALGLGQRPHPEPGLTGLWHHYDCGVKGMQLRVFPRPGQTIRFKVVGECG